MSTRLCAYIYNLDSIDLLGLLRHVWNFPISIVLVTICCITHIISLDSDLSMLRLVFIILFEFRETIVIRAETAYCLIYSKKVALSPRLNS